jgi:hypothetical protein
MRRIEPEDDQTQGQDSFLDVIANMVGILILLVMVVGLRASKMPVLALANDQQPGPVSAPSSEEPASKLPEQVAKLQAEIGQLVVRVATNEQEEQLREAERVQLAAHAQKVRAELDRRKATLDDARRAELEIVQNLNEARSRLDELAEAQMAITSLPERVEEIECLPTPLAQAARDEELHLRLKRGMVSVIPLDELVAGLEEHAKTHSWKLAGQSSLEETVGPVGGYRLRYRLVQRRLVVQSATGPLNQGNVVQFEGWELLPLADDLGQPVEQALLPGSELQMALANRRPETTTITIWTYPDSFSEFRSLKKALFERGFATAARPLPEGVRIGGSPRGSKSMAE